MAARISLGVESGRDHLRRLSVVFAVELRLKIVTELYMREMSPAQFYREFGGGTPSRVARNFGTLEKNGWLRAIGPAPAKSGRGKEILYRAPDLAFIGPGSWALLPYSLRVASSWNIFNQIAQRLRDAIEASSVEAQQGGSLTCTRLSVDELGWRRASDAVAAVFVSLFEEQEDSRRRAFNLGAELFRADVFQIAFEMPMQAGKRPGPSLVESDKEFLVPFSERLAPVFADDVCMQIVAESNRREISVIQFQREFGVRSRRTLYRRFNRLEEIGWLEKVDEKQGGMRRGGTEYFYRATKPAITEGGPWAHPSESHRGTDNWNAFEQLSARVTEAMKAETFDARLDRCQAWSLLQLDRQGWEKVIAGLDALRTYLLEEQERARDRMRKSGERQVTMLVALGAFEAPRESVKAP
jgi:hypothetical protein